jgi:hypothetical protein
MKLIKDLPIKPFCRMLWVSDEARRVWENPVKRCADMVNRLEVDSVEAGHRRCSWQTIDEYELPGFAKRMADKGLITLVVHYTGKFDGFAHYTVPFETGKPKNVSVVISRSIEDARDYKTAFETGDNDKQGWFLGFPKCCREFFTDIWPKGYYDPIWQMADRENPHPFSNPLLRYIGLRVGFHIPHSFNCKATIELARQRLSIADKHLSKILIALLSMPMSWEVLHGIAFVRTPIFYLIVSSVPSEEKYKVELQGKFIPREASEGIAFPFSEVNRGN